MSQSHPSGREARAKVQVQVGRREPLRRIWRYVGYDEPNYSYTPDGRLLLSKLGQMADAPYYIRCHFMLCSGDGTGSPKWGSSNVYTEDAEGRAVYSWAIIDRILDTILETGNVPFVEIGFMPQALSSAPPDLPYEGARAEGWRYPPTDHIKWRDLIGALGEHCLARYGLRGVSRWYWELWNEPDISYWRGTVEEYCRLYDYTADGLLAAIPQAKVGGRLSPGFPRSLPARDQRRHRRYGHSAGLCQLSHQGRRLWRRAGRAQKDANPQHTGGARGCGPGHPCRVSRAEGARGQPVRV